MKQVKEIFDYLNDWADVQLAEDWDNVGLLVDAGKPIKKVLVTLDITHKVIEEAVEKDCQLIVSHHPVIFKPVKRIHHTDLVFVLIEKGISAICMHTNLDATEGGVNDVLANLLEMKNVESFAEIGRVGEIPAVSTIELAKIWSDKLGNKVMVADAGKKISRLAVIGGSGGSFFKEAILARADALLTGEASHHHGIDAVEAGLSLLVAGHFETEQPVVKELCIRLQQEFEDIEVFVSERHTTPYTLV